jgi:DNA gyrase/topoisomerase IV subunit A
MIYAVCDIDEVIADHPQQQDARGGHREADGRAFRIPRGTRTSPKFPPRLMEGNITEAAEPRGGDPADRVQAEAIGAMRLIQLVGLEIEKLVASTGKLVEEIEGYEEILAETRRCWTSSRPTAPR